MIFLMWVALLGSATHIAFGQSMLPGSSVLFAPTVPAETDGRVWAGFARVPQEVRQPSRVCARYPVEPNCAENQYLVSLQFVPRLELNYKQVFRSTTAPQATGDRSLGAVLRVIDESQYRPAFAIGIRDVAGTRKNHAMFGVARKDVSYSNVHASLTAGYAFSFLDASYRELKDGPFGGGSIGYRDWIHVLGEYDTRYWNAGVRITAVPYVWFQWVLFDMQHQGYSAGLRLDLAD